MEQILNEIMQSGGLPAFVCGMALFIKYLLTISFLIFGTLAFLTYMTKKEE